MAEAYQFTAGPARALFFYGQTLIGIGKTLSDTTFNTEITAEEVRGGPGNLLYGQYFHDSNLTVEISDAMFNLNYVAASLGVDVEMGGLSLYESSKAGEEVETANQITLTNTPVAFEGSIIGWYKLPTDTEWKIATINDKIMSIPGATVGQYYCVKYFYQNPNAQSITIKAQYVPKVLHLVLINDLYSGDVANVAASSTKYGRLITDIPQFQLDGSQNIAWSATSTATVSLSGKALAFEAGDSCEEDPIYGTMTKEVFNSKWQDSVVALAVENSDIELSQSDTETIIVRAVYGGNIASQRQPNSNFTFAVESSPESTATGTSVGAHDGKITAGTQAGTAIISVNLTDYTTKVAPAFVTVTVT